MSTQLYPKDTVQCAPGKLVFAGDQSGNFIAFDATNGKILWNARIGAVSNAPQTYLLDGKQHVLVAAGDALYDFYLHRGIARRIKNTVERFAETGGGDMKRLQGFDPPEYRLRAGDYRIRFHLENRVIRVLRVP